METQNLKINSDRYEKLLLELANITHPDIPYTRRSFSPEFLKGRQWLSQKMQELGLKVRIDPAGNLIGKREGKIHNNLNKHTIAIGSHIDTVPNGGRYDGIAGVIAGLECVAALNDLNIELYHHLEIIDFLAEEPSEWGISCIGSRGISGFLSQKLLETQHPETKEPLYKAITKVGGDSSKLVKSDYFKAFFELHIEQGKVLETTQTDLGIVSSIVGIMRIQVEFSGEANHAGTTPMDLRKDAGIAACKAAVCGNELATDLSNSNDSYFVATSGQIQFKPNATNVICGESKIVFDIRSDNRQMMEDFRDKIWQKVKDIAMQEKVIVKNFEILTDTHPVYCDQNLMTILKESTLQNETSFMVMPSGAGHDSAFISYIAPVAMIFVPSKDGKSHCPEEYTSKEHLGLGTNTLFEAILKYDTKFK